MPTEAEQFAADVRWLGLRCWAFSYFGLQAGVWGVTASCREPKGLLSTTSATPELAVRRLRERIGRDASGT